MCGRFELHTLVGVLAVLFDFEDSIPIAVRPRYNIAPTQAVLAVRKTANGDKREGVFFRWGLVPHWAKDVSVGNKMINARGESVAEKPSFREAFKMRRCLIIADGYYEWLNDGKVKRPFLFHRKDAKPFAFAGLWESWEKGDKPLETCTIVTTEANSLTKDIHDRMPVILPTETHAKWLGEEPVAQEELEALLKPFPSEKLSRYEVSRAVGSPKNDVEDCIKPISPKPTL